MRILEENDIEALQLDELARTLRLLSNADRLSMLWILETGEQDVSSLAQRSKLSSSRVSQHLALLRAHDVVRDRREGRRVFYRLIRPALVQWLRGSVEQGVLEPATGVRA